jgi:hypothetical protein
VAFRKDALSIVACLCCSAGFANSASADIIFRDDFSSGNYDNWTVSGAGDASVTGGMLQLTKTIQAVASVSTIGYVNVSVGMSMSAQSLESGESCDGEVSADGGATWTTVIHLSYSQDTGMVYSGSAAPASASNNANVALRLRVNGTTVGDYCKADNIVVSGSPGSVVIAPDISAASSADFGTVTPGNAKDKVVAVGNTGNAALLIGAVSTPLTPFAKIADTCSGQSITAGGACSVTIRFGPGAASSYSSSFSISSNDPDTPLATVSLSGIGGTPSAIYDPLSGTGAVVRTALAYGTLTGTTSSLVDYSAYAVPAGAANPDFTFEGTLTLTDAGSGGSFAVVHGTTSGYSDPGHLPPFSYQFVQTGTHIVPVQRGLLATAHPDWNYILEPGRVWKESSDNGYLRVAIPFSLQETGDNCTHNGVLTFLFKDDGSVSRVSYQIAAETCEYFQMNAWGNLSATYTPQSLPDSAGLISAYQAEVARRMPTKPISQLAVDYPAAGIVTAKIGSQQTAAYMTLFGVAVDGTNYVGGCNTRYGAYPYCDVMDVPSYSISKSVAGAIGLMRMEKKYGGSQKALTIGSWVAECSGSQWVNVTLLNALDLATGNYTSSKYEFDEGSIAMSNGFFLQDSYAAKSSFACSYVRKATPGTTWVYHTTDDFLLGRAMQNHYRAQEGPTRDYYADMLVAELWKPLGLSPTTYTTVRTRDSAAQPYTGYGLTFHRDDLVKLGEFLNKDGGRIGGVQMLDGTMLDEALQKTTNHGLAAGAATARYLHGFWNYNAKSDLGCGSDKWLPYMSGYGGIGVVLLPNNMVYYYVSDNMEYGFIATVKELNKIRANC